MAASIYDIPVEKITGETASLAEFKGKVLLVVNVASKCGLTPQYEGLENLYEQFKRSGPGGCWLSRQRLQEPGAGTERGDSDVLPANLRRQVSDVQQDHGGRR